MTRPAPARDGLIERQPDPADRRSSPVRLTPSAVARLPAVRAVLVRGYGEMQAGFSPAGREALLDQLGRVVANVEAAAGRVDGGSKG